MDAIDPATTHLSRCGSLGLRSACAILMGLRIVPGNGGSRSLGQECSCSGMAHLLAVRILDGTRNLRRSSSAAGPSPSPESQALRAADLRRAISVDDRDCARDIRGRLRRPDTHRVRKGRTRLPRMRVWPWEKFRWVLPRVALETRVASPLPFPRDCGTDGRRRVLPASEPADVTR